ncbi:hypothetical protein M918_15190 [Clostridium sp. BL8]|uniref:hypothetical protein n=1 Tax=Clostridium sp. BL8 TaxID=1354301 RepID=UPI000389DACA|nr:hypothetical protein [Clostridium sp. BL8]EQB86281.1 hypothetical protein M918_15190 [Clostridium sp. BL8]
MAMVYELCKITNYDLRFEVEPEKGFFNSQGTITIFNDTKEAFKKLSIMLYHDLSVKNIRNTENESLVFFSRKGFIRRRRKLPSKLHNYKFK